MLINAPTEKTIRLLKNVAWVSAIFGVLLSLLLILNYLQTKKADPLNTKAMTILVERLKDNPGDDQLRNEIRELDLLARKAFFTSQWQIRAGGILLFINLVVFILAYQAIDYFRKRVPELPPGQATDFWSTRTSSRKWIIGSGLLILFSVVLFSIFYKSDLENQIQTATSSSKENSKGSSLTINQNEGENGQKKVDETLSQSDSNLSQIDTLVPSARRLGSEGNWPSFRGPGGNGVAFVKNVPVSWDGKSGKNVKWKTEIPLSGYNSPIVWKDKIFLSGANDKKREVFCIDLESGKILWEKTVENVAGSPAQAPKVNSETGFSAPTLATDGARVYAIFANGDIIALDFNGEKVWDKNLGLPKNHYGHSSSLVTYQDKVIVQYDQTGNANVIALSGKTGQEVWRTARNVRVSWSSPVLVNTGQRMELLLTADPFVASYDPSSGKELWKMDAISGEVGPSVAYGGGIVFSVNEYSKLAAIQIGDPPKQLWEDNEYLSDVPSPVATDKYLFLATSYGTVVCYDAKGGNRYWEKEFGTQTYSSPILAEGKIYLMNSKGTMYIFKADKTFSLIGQPQIGEGSFCTPAFIDGRIILRGDKNLFCIGE